MTLLLIGALCIAQPAMDAEVFEPVMVARKCDVKLEKIGALEMGRYAWPNEGEAVVFSRRTKNRLVPLKGVYAAADITSITAVRAHHFLFEVQACVHGTGGCTQTFFRLRNGQLTPVASSLRKRFNAQLPAGYTTYKSPMLDADRMIVEGYGWKKKDANCCPSIHMECHVALVGDEARLSGCKESPNGG